jgi:hypothetical protein
MTLQTAPSSLVVWSLLLAVSTLAASTLAGCVAEVGDFDPLDEQATLDEALTCATPQMATFPVAAPHNIGWDRASCGSGACAVSCPDRNANSDWSSRDHQGVDIFAHHRAPLVAAATGTVVAVGVVSRTSGLRVRIRDHCGWEYYYGHLDQAVVHSGQHVSAGQLIGYMGSTGTRSVHLHFNISPDGQYANDINPFNLLYWFSATACPSTPPPPEPTPTPTPTPTPAPAGCGILGSNAALAPNQSVRSCDGRFNLVHQGDGNVVLYHHVTPIWHTHTNGRATSSFVMQGDGNLVLYDTSMRPIWYSGTHGHHGATLGVQDDGNVVIYGGGRALWSTGTCCR